MVAGQNQTRATLMGGKRSHYCAIPSPLKINTIVFNFKSKVPKRKLTCTAACQGSRPEMRKANYVWNHSIKLQFDIVIRVLLVVTAIFIVFAFFLFILLKVRI